jgi:phosphohistidine phosphatase
VRTLVLLRHGKSGYPDGVDDHDRPLADRGQREAPVAGRLLRRSLADHTGRTGADGPAVDLVLVSSARRAQETWLAVAPEMGEVGQVQTQDDLYLATVEDLLDVVHDLPDAAATVLVVGHNDGLEMLAAELSGADVRLKTSTYAVLTSERAWARWSAGGVDLADLVVAR